MSKTVKWIGKPTLDVYKSPPAVSKSRWQCFSNVDVYEDARLFRMFPKMEVQATEDIFLCVGLREQKMANVRLLSESKLRQIWRLQFVKKGHWVHRREDCLCCWVSSSKTSVGLVSHRSEIDWRDSFMFKKIRISLGLFFYVALRSEIVVMLLLSKPSKAPSKTEKARVQLTKDLTFPWEGSAHFTWVSPTPRLLSIRLLSPPPKI